MTSCLEQIPWGVCHLAQDPGIKGWGASLAPKSPNGTFPKTSFILCKLQANLLLIKSLDSYIKTQESRASWLTPVIPAL